MLPIPYKILKQVLNILKQLNISPIHSNVQGSILSTGKFSAFCQSFLFWENSYRFFTLCSKPRWLSLWNWIVLSDSISDYNLKWQNPSDSKFDFEIRFWKNNNVDFWLKLTYFWLKCLNLLDFQYFLNKIWLKRSKMVEIHPKCKNLLRMVKFNLNIDLLQPLLNKINLFSI